MAGKIQENLDTLTLAQIAEGLDQRAFTVVDLAKAHLDRIHKWNVIVNAVIEINPGAIQSAQGLDNELATLGRRR
jgi:amidase